MKLYEYALTEHHQALGDGIREVVLFDFFDDAVRQPFFFWNEQQSRWAVNSFSYSIPGSSSARVSSRTFLGRLERFELFMKSLTASG